MIKVVVFVDLQYYVVSFVFLLFSIDFFVYVFVFLSVKCLDYEKTVEPICMKFSGKVWSDHGTT